MAACEATLESAWGRSELVLKANHLFGAKQQAYPMSLSSKTGVFRGKCGVEARLRRSDGLRSKVEWPFGILKRVFGFTRVRYRGLKKSHEWLLATFALVNLYQHRKHLASLGA